mmetsp:Transcript_111863/g.198139  ORF Transcript_111863/g.198139 Transcript_111863/m.198139 type:complete len:255 (-) Transcript_111863:113-877(-)
MFSWWDGPQGFSRWWRSEPGHWRECEADPLCSNSRCDKEGQPTYDPNMDLSALSNRPTHVSYIRGSSFDSHPCQQYTEQVLFKDEQSMIAFDDGFNTRDDMIYEPDDLRLEKSDSSHYICIGVCHPMISDGPYHLPESLRMTETTLCQTPPCHTPPVLSPAGSKYTPRTPDMRRAVTELDVVREKLRKNSVVLAIAQLDAMQHALEQNARLLASLQNQVAKRRQVDELSILEVDEHAMDIAMNAIEGLPAKMSL